MRIFLHKYLFIFSFLYVIIGPIRLNGAYAQSSVQQFDDKIMIDLMHSRTPAKNDFFVLVSKTNNYGDIGVPAGLLVGGWLGHDQQMRQNALFVASSTALSYGLTALIKTIVKRPRPFVQNVHIIPVYRAQNYSFPSGHTSSSFATASALSMAYPKWYVIAPAYLWAGSIAYSRMYLGVHYPTDVGAGALLGAGSAISMSLIKK